MELPLFVKLNHSALRLIKGRREHSDFGYYAVPSKYFRDAGNWEVRFRQKKGKLYVYAPDSADLMHRYNNVELIPITKEEWELDNKEYAPRWIGNEPSK